MRIIVHSSFTDCYFAPSLDNSRVLQALILQSTSRENIFRHSLDNHRAFRATILQTRHDLELHLQKNWLTQLFGTCELSTKKHKHIKQRLHRYTKQSVEPPLSSLYSSFFLPFFTSTMPAPARITAITSRTIQIMVPEF